MDSRGKYLSYEVLPGFSRPAGLRHRTGDLKRLVWEAIRFNRIVVMPETNFLPLHNFGFSAKHLDWAMFYDVDYERGTLRLQVPNETGLAEVRVISREAFKEKKITENEMCRIAPNQKVPLDAEGKKVVVCEIGSEGWGKSRPGPKVVEISFEPSAQVRKLGDEVISDLTADGKKFSYLHVRRGDKVRGRPTFPLYTSPWCVRLFIRAHFTKGATMYLGTDDVHEDFVGGLNKNYRAICYKQYPDLKELITGTKPNNYLLFAVEEYISRRSAYYVGTFNLRSAKQCLIPGLSMLIWEFAFRLIRQNRVLNVFSNLKVRRFLVKAFVAPAFYLVFARHVLSLVTKYVLFRKNLP